MVADSELSRTPLAPTTLALDAPQFAALAAELLRARHQLRFQATGGSMRPFVRDGDILTVHPATPDRYRSGDVVLCQAGGGVVAHRVVAIQSGATGRHFLVRGDASCGRPDTIPAEAMLGRVVQQDRASMRRSLDHTRWRSAGLLWAWAQSCRGVWRRARRRAPL